jgi:hypothetical protein
MERTKTNAIPERFACANELRIELSTFGKHKVFGARIFGIGRLRHLGSGRALARKDAQTPISEIERSLIDAARRRIANGCRAQRACSGSMPVSRAIA